MGVIKVFFILIVLFPLTGSAQPYETNPDFNRTRNWHFGHGVGLRFDPDTIYEVQTSIHTDEAAAIHSDADGNLLLYSNGEKIWNANHEVIHNGNLSLGNISSSMGSVFVFHEDNPNYIYLFNNNHNLSNNMEMSYNLILREADTFRIVFKDSILQTNICEPIAVVKTGDGKDLWIVSHAFGANIFYAYRLTKEGVIYCPVLSEGNTIPTGRPQAAFFDMVFSSDGKYLLKSNTNLISTTRGVELYKFENDRGSLSYLFSIDNLRYPVSGICFSHDNKIIYVVERDSHINHFNFYPDDSLETVNSRSKIYINDEKFELQKFTFNNLIGISIAYNNKIPFIENSNGDTLSIISEKINLNNGYTFVGLPNFNQSYFYTPSINFTYELNCNRNSMQFNGQDTFSATIHDWLMSKQGTSPIISNLKNPLIEFVDTGTYQIRYIASNGSKSDTLIKGVTILPKTNPSFLGSDSGWCEQIDTSIILHAPNNMFCYEWSTGETTSLITVDTAGVYIAKITTPNYCVIYDTITISLDSVPSVPIIYLDNDSTIKTDDIYPVYKWFRNNTHIGTNQPFLKLTDTGVYHIEITTNGGCTAISDTIQIIAPKDTFDNVVQPQHNSTIKLYPNPFGSSFQVELIGFVNTKLSISDISGRKITELYLTQKQNTIETNTWSEGVYIITITLNTGETINYKLIKINE